MKKVKIDQKLKLNKYVITRLNDIKGGQRIPESKWRLCETARKECEDKEADDQKSH